MILSSQDKEFIEFAWGCINRARYADSKTIVDTYNRVFADRVNFTKKPYTSCGSCLRQYCAEMKRELDALLAKMEKEQENKKVNEEPVQELEITELTLESIEDVKEPPMVNVKPATKSQKKNGGRKTKD